MILSYSRTHSRACSTCSRNVSGTMGIVNENLAQFSKQQEQVKASGDPGSCLPGEAVVFSPMGCGLLGPSLRSSSHVFPSGSDVHRRFASQSGISGCDWLPKSSPQSNRSSFSLGSFAFPFNAPLQDPLEQNRCLWPLGRVCRFTHWVGSRQSQEFS